MADNHAEGARLTDVERQRLLSTLADTAGRSYAPDALVRQIEELIATRLGPGQVHMASGNDAMNLLIDIYMDGFTTGAASVLATYTAADDATADRMVEHLTEGLRSDPLAVETIRREIAERFAGVDSGEKAFTIPAPDAPEEGQNRG